MVKDHAARSAAHYLLREIGTKLSEISDSILPFPSIDLKTEGKHWKIYSSIPSVFHLEDLATIGDKLSGKKRRFDDNNSGSNKRIKTIFNTMDFSRRY